MRVWPVLLLVVLAGAVELEVEEQEVAEVQEDTREREVRADNLPPPSRPQRRPSSGAGFSSFLSGLLGSVTKTANVDACPGKCIHALASLMCDSVLEEVQCPSSSMRCCVEKSGGMPPRPSDSSIPGLSLDMPPRPSGSPPRSSPAPREDAEEVTDKPEETTKKKRRKKKKDRTTTTTATTTTKAEEVTTTKPTKKSDKDKDYEYEEESSSSSNTSMSAMSLPSPTIITLGLATYVLTFLCNSKPIF